MAIPQRGGETPLTTKQKNTYFSMIYKKNYQNLMKQKEN